jgi:23S rRNA (uracil1939-C5)-methyltransferase
LSNEKRNLPDGDLEIVVERILPGGRGLAHAEGQTVMVPLAAPGDRLRVRIDRVKGNVWFASIIEILEPSLHRIEPPCPYFGRCGGCDFQQLNYQAQLDAKIGIITDCLRRLGKIDDVPKFEVTPAPQAWHYRARAQWQFDSAGQKLGYFESGSRRVCDVADCAILSADLQETLEQLREQMRANNLPREVRDFRAVAGDDLVSVAAETNRQNTVLEITREIHGETYHFNARSFFQANIDLLPSLIDCTIGKVTGQTAIELYCGVGLFTLPLARRFSNVVGIESDRAAARFAQKNLARAGLTNAKVLHGDVGGWLTSDATRWVQEHAESHQLDFLLLDPPRTGVESKVISAISNLAPQKICYVSCDPATLARDLKKLLASGYMLDSIAAFDMFPQTHHVEIVIDLLLTG